MTAIGMSFLLTRIWYVVKGYRILEPLLTCCGYQKSNSHLECVHQLSKANTLAAQQYHHCSIEWLIRFHVASVRPPSNIWIDIYSNELWEESNQQAHRRPPLLFFFKVFYSLCWDASISCFLYGNI